jgi:hypothetical protein
MIRKRNLFKLKTKHKFNEKLQNHIGTEICGYDFKVIQEVKGLEFDLDSVD